MGIVTSSIYSTTAKDPMTRLEFSTDFQESSASVTINLVKDESVLKTQTYNLSESNLIENVSLEASKITSDATITFATDGRSVVFSGVCVWKDVTSFSATNVAIAYR